MRNYYDYGPMAAHHNGGYGLIGLGIFVLFLIAVALIASRLLRRHGSRWFGHRDPIDIARERYARGEIDKDQFEQIKKDLA